MLTMRVGYQGRYNCLYRLKQPREADASQWFSRQYVVRLMLPACVRQYGSPCLIGICRGRLGELDGPVIVAFHARAFPSY